MDHMMPGVNGIEATAAIRATEGDYFKQVPIIALTANAVSGMREMFLANGFSDFLAKPIELQKLNALIERWVPQEKRVRAEGGAAHESAPIEVDLKIDGVDVPRGIMMTGGTLEGYKNVLGLYCRDVSERLEILREPRDEIELAQIVIQVHALKSASASIGAVSVAESAAFLEDAGRQGDMGAVLARFGDFRDSLGILYENIRSVLSPDSQSGERAIDIEALERLQAALLAENIREADSVVMELENAGVDDKTREFLSITAEKILLSEFKSAAVSVEDFIRENRK
jgi:CheY-like chemotaxis protein